MSPSDSDWAVPLTLSLTERLAAWCHAFVATPSVYGAEALLADRVEAACRTLKDPSRENIRLMIQGLVNGAVTDGICAVDPGDM